jgi:alpha-tubulin suppressor-like RCC1 family protein
MHRSGGHPLLLAVRRIRFGPVIAGLLSGMVAACGGGDNGPSDPVATVTVAPPTPAVAVGATVQLAATAKNAQGDALTGRTVAWSTSNAAVATVDASSGLVTGVAPGTATITATIEGKQGTATVTVAATAVASVDVSPTPVSIHAGTTVQLTATPKDANGTPLTGRTVAWTSSNANVASVDPTSGLVSGIAEGPATITATVEGQQGTSAVTVTAAAFVSITAGEGFTCGVTTLSETVCWGDNFFGELGTGNNTPALLPTVTGAFISVSAGLGSSHACGTSVAQLGFCWGANGSGEVGNGSADFTVKAPAAVSGGLTFESLQAGNGSSCGVATNGNAYCWGAMSEGLGDAAATTSSNTPVLVSGGLTFSVVSAANNFACGLTTDGKIFCWGANDRGQLGRGNQDPGPTPVEVLGGRTYTAVSARHQHACAIATGGAAYCWGPNDNGQGGLGTQLGFTTEPTAVAGGLTFQAISAGMLHACGVTTAGAAYCWGDNTNGELGDGGNDLADAPVAVSGGLTFGSISAGSITTCGVTTAGDGYCWGAGDLGDGTPGGKTSNVPVKVTVP